MYHIKLTSPLTARTRKIIAENYGEISYVNGDKSARFVTLPGWFQPEYAKRVEQELYAAQREDF